MSDCRLSDAPCAEGTDPRSKGRCFRCGTVIAASGIGPAKPFVPDLASDHSVAPMAVGLPATDPTRDPELETRFLDEVVETAQRLTGIFNPSYPLAAIHRLDVGFRRYGVGDYLLKDNLKEVREETPDIATYSVLELTKQKRVGLQDDKFNDLWLALVACAAYGAVADYYAQRATEIMR